MDTKKKFFVGGLPDAPFGHRWEIAPVYEARRIAHPVRIGDPEWQTADPETTMFPNVRTRYEVENKMVKGEWLLRMINTETGKDSERQLITSLYDRDIVMVAELLVNRFVSRNRAKALEEGPVILG